MPIIACPDCGQRASSTARACPACGYAIAEQLKFKGRRQGYVLVAVGVVAFIGVALLTDSGSDKSPKPPPEPTPLTGQTWLTKSVIVGCTEEKDFERLNSLARQKDSEAFSKLYMAATITGKCWMLDEGTVVYIEHGAVLGHPCVRPKGDPLLHLCGRRLIETPRKLTSPAGKSDEEEAIS